jgi:hypothetical protein
MEQQLDSSYLGHDHLERSLAFAVRAIFLGLSVLLAAWGISLVWKAAVRSSELRVDNPEVRQVSPTPVTLPPIPKTADQTGIDREQVIRREVTVFTFVRHASGSVVTGWSYKDGAASKPIRQFCYFSSPNSDGTKTWVDLAIDRKQLPSINEAVVPNVDDALSKCQWFGD